MKAGVGLLDGELLEEGPADDEAPEEDALVEDAAPYEVENDERVLVKLLAG